jgi:Domain of unknown function (DUF222)
MSQSPFAPGQPVLFTAFDVVGEALDTAGDCALFGLTDTETVEGLRRVSRTIARMEAVGLRLVSEVVGRDLARRCGVTSVPVFLRDRLHWSPREAARRVRLARSLNDDALVDVAEALRRGDVTLEHADVIGRMFRVLKRAGVAADDLVVALEMQLASAGRFDPATLSTLARRTVAALAPRTEEDRERRARHRRGFSLRSNDDGTSSIIGCIPDADALQLAAAIDVLAAPRPGLNGERDLRTPPARRLDALMEMVAYVVRHGHDDGTELDLPDDPDDPDPDPDGGHGSSGHGGPGGGLARAGSCAGAGPGGCGDHGGDGDGDGPGFNPDSLFDPSWNFPDPNPEDDLSDTEPAGDVTGDGGGDPDGSGDGDGDGSGDGGTPAQAGDAGRQPASGQPAGGNSVGRKPAGRKSGRGSGQGAPQIIITCGLSYLLGEPDGRLSGPETLTQLPLTRAAFELLSCNAIIRRVILDSRGIPLNVGRKSRTVTPAIRDAVIVRDRVCSYPSCDRPPGWSQVHHVAHWTRDGGETSLLNSALVCTFHHDLVHHHGYEVRIGEHGRPEWRSPYNIDPTGTWRLNELREPRCPLQRPNRT